MYTIELWRNTIRVKLAELAVTRRTATVRRDELLVLEQNLIDFPNSFSVQIMVPVAGTFGLMRGSAYHTNEILVRHGLSCLSQASASTALQICRLRLRNAEQHLSELDGEERLLQDRLEVAESPDMFGGVEIIEETTAEMVDEWREQHKIAVRKHKKEEAERRSQLNEPLATLDEGALVKEVEEKWC